MCDVHMVEAALNVSICWSLALRRVESQVATPSVMYNAYVTVGVTR